MQETAGRHHCTELVLGLEEGIGPPSGKAPARDIQGKVVVVGTAPYKEDKFWR